MSVKLISITPDTEKLILYCARVSNPKKQDCGDSGLLRFCIREGHISIFEMGFMVVEVKTSRDVSAQMLRHKGLSFQEFSQRYAKVLSIELTNPRRQDKKNRQNSIDDIDDETKIWWAVKEHDLHEHSMRFYEESLAKGISKESARRLLPMASSTTIYIAANIRNWMLYLNVRARDDVQLEHRVIAQEIRDTIFKQELPVIYEAFFGE